MAKKPNRIINYFKEVKSELKKVVWPSFKQVKNNTLIVIICVLLVGAFIWILDLGFAKGWTVINPTEQAQTENVETVPETETPSEDAVPSGDVVEENATDNNAGNTAQ